MGVTVVTLGSEKNRQYWNAAIHKRKDVGYESDSNADLENFAEVWSQNLQKYSL